MGPVPSPEQTRRGGTNRKCGALKLTELLHTKIDILKLRIMRYLKNFVFMSEKRDV